MMTARQTLDEALSLGVTLEAEGDDLHIKAPLGVMTLDLKRALKEHKDIIIYVITLPPPARAGHELEQLRRQIGEMARATSLWGT